MFYRIYIPRIGSVDRDTFPEGVGINWSSTVYEDGHREGAIYLSDNPEMSYCFEEVY